MKRYDYPTLESYSKYVHRLVRVVFNLESNAWSSPAKCLQARAFHAHSAAFNHRYDLQLYDRTVAIEHVPSTTVPILV
jgi:hypothetical protein